MYILQSEYILIFFPLITNCLLITVGSLKMLPGFFKKMLVLGGVGITSQLQTQSSDSCLSRILLLTNLMQRVTPETQSDDVFCF